MVVVVAQSQIQRFYAVGVEDVGIAAATKCHYCVLFHTEVAKLHGATDAEIEDALHFAKSSAGWSTYINGLQIDFDEFKAEVRRIVEHVRSLQPAGV